MVGWIVLGVVFYAASGKYRTSVTEEERNAALFHSMKED
jgi:hypothetical protein